MGKPVAFTPEDLAKLAILNPSNLEIAAVFECDVRTVQRHIKRPQYAEALSRGRGQRLVSLKRAQWKAAVEKGIPSMLIWLGKQELGQSDEPSGANDIPLPWPE